MEQEIGKVSHYYSKISVVVIALSNALKVGDTIHIKGVHTDFQQTIESMQIEHEKIQEAKAGQSIGLKISQPVHEHDTVYRVA